MSDTVIESGELRLRRWRPSDAAAFAALNADPEVMRHFPAPLDRAASDALMARIEQHFQQHGFGAWALEIDATTAFAGFVGLSVPSFEAHFLPGVEIGWRLAPAYWGRGYVTRAARAALAYGFETLDLKEIVSFTVPANQRSWRVMQRLGMQRNPADDFDHPALPPGHRLRRHLLYRLSQQAWRTPTETPP